MAKKSVFVLCFSFRRLAHVAATSITKHNHSTIEITSVTIDQARITCEFKQGSHVNSLPDPILRVVPTQTRTSNMFPKQNVKLCPTQKSKYIGCQYNITMHVQIHAEIPRYCIFNLTSSAGRTVINAYN